MEQVLCAACAEEVRWRLSGLLCRPGPGPVQPALLRSLWSRAFLQLQLLCGYLGHACRPGAGSAVAVAILVVCWEHRVSYHQSATGTVQAALKKCGWEGSCAAGEVVAVQPSRPWGLCQAQCCAGRRAWASDSLALYPPVVQPNLVHLGSEVPQGFGAEQQGLASSTNCIQSARICQPSQVSGRPP